VPTAFKVLGQAAPAAATSVALYTAPAATSAIVSTVVICNLATSQTTFRLRVAVAGAAVANPQYLFYETVLPAATTVTLTIGLTLAATDVLACQSASGSVAFSAFGQENS
jgi:hypothetical protein